MQIIQIWKSLNRNQKRIAMIMAANEIKNLLLLPTDEK